MNKIRTLNQLQENLDAEFSWRLKEIANLKSFIKDYKPPSQNTMLRASLPLMYAHWEGFIKNSAEAYINFISNQKHKYNELTSCFIVFGIKEHLSFLTQSLKSDKNIAAVDFFFSNLDDKANLHLSEAVNTESNLSSSVFENIALSIGIDTNNYNSKYHFIDESLLKRRNKIVHGNYMNLDDKSFKGFADEVIGLLRTFKDDIENAASLKSYLRV
ncbi:MAG: hypothetical protein HQ568_08580 [Calditrichaeota bacterium]|nr:hypothetical protein [Calditrichota bacterium]